MTEKTALFTGHRLISRTELPKLLQALDETIDNLIQQGILIFRAGGAIGFDLYASQAVRKAREKNPDIKLIISLPCRDWNAKWKEADKAAYQEILNAADAVECLSEKYYDGCMRARNLHLVQHSSVCVAYMKRTFSGSAQTIRFAREKGLRIINLAEE